MGLLDKLWDDTLAGPQPETGLSRLRKPASFALRTNSGKEESSGVGITNGIARSDGEDPSDGAPRVTRCIMIKRPAGCPSPGSGTPPLSPASGSTPPVSPLFGSGGRDWGRFRRKSSSDAYERRAGGEVVGVGPRSSPPPYEV